MNDCSFGHPRLAPSAHTARGAIINKPLTHSATPKFKLDKALGYTSAEHYGIVL
jgi:hypothetical protein